MSKLIRLSYDLSSIEISSADEEVINGLSDRAQEMNWMISGLGTYIMDDFGNGIELDPWSEILHEW